MFMNAKRGRGFIYIASLVLLVSSGAALWARSGWSQRVPDIAEADKLYAEKSYAGALHAYESIRKAGRAPSTRGQEIRYRIAVCLGKSEQWDRAITESLAFVRANRGSVWEPRGLYWMGRLYLALPHQGYRVGKKFYRGQNVPKASGPDQPQYVDVSQQDSQNALDALEAARYLYYRFREPGAKAGMANRNEEIQLDFDLSNVLLSDPRFARWVSKPGDWVDPRSAFWDVDPSGPYVISDPMPKKQRYLFAEIHALGKGTRFESLGLLGEAMWLRRYHSMMPGYAVRWEGEKRIPIPYPYQSIKPHDLLAQIITSFPQTSIRDKAQILLGAWLQEDRRFTDALKEYRSLIADRPASVWTNDAKVAIDGITRVQFSLDSSAPRLPEGDAAITVRFRNTNRIHFSAYRVKLESILGAENRLRNPDVQWNQFGENYGPLKTATANLGAPIKEWDLTTTDRGDYLPRSMPVKLPVSDTGAYMVVASAGSVRAATIEIVSNLVLIQKSHRDGILYFAANGTTGAPVAGAAILVKQTWYENDSKGKQIRKASYWRTKTGQGGLVTVRVPNDARRQNLQVSALAWHAAADSGVHGGGSHYAVTNPNGWYFGGSVQQASLKVYSTTDRSVYRPLQTVNYREIVYRSASGGLKPLAGTRVHIEARNPKGELVHQRDSVTGEFGSVNGKFDLAEGAPLGEYAVNVTVLKTGEVQADAGSSRFRVEEYKKPEFEVTVTPAADRVRLGDSASVKVVAKYYFGGPVPGAKVTYRIHRQPFEQQYRFPRPFDFLWRYWGEGDYDYGFRNGPVVKQGEARLDANGEATISFPTDKRPPESSGMDQAYTVEADVQDASRRVITGSGTVKATQHTVAVFLNYPHGYAIQGDRLDVEIMTLNPSEQPVSVPGIAKVYRIPANPNGKDVLIFEHPEKTDEHGRAYLHWKADTSGWFRIAFETSDDAGSANGRDRLSDLESKTVSGSVEVCVEGPELQHGRFKRDGVFLAVKNPYYEEGETAKALIVTPMEGCTVLLTREANSEIIDKRVIHVPGRSLEIDVPLHHSDVPNVYMSAVMVRDGQMFTAQQELFVPPARQFTSITVQADKPSYQPGEKAMLRLAARDWQGRPLRTELCVSVTDAALSYIQKDYAPDIRAYLYGDRRSVSTEVSGSPGVGLQGAVDDEQRSINLRTHSWDLPDGMGMLPDWPSNSQYQMRHQMAGGLGESDRGTLTAFSGFTRDAVDGLQTPANMPMSLSSVRQEGRPAGLGMMGPSGGMVQDYDGRKVAIATRTTTIDLAGEMKSPVVRSKFVDTAFWTPAAVTDSEGNATVQVTWPDNLTKWRAQAVGTTIEAQVGSGESSVTTKKDLIVRLQSPRFFVERDQVLLTANVQNNTDSAQRVRVKLDLSSDNVEVVSASAGKASTTVLTSLSRRPNPVNPVKESLRESWVDVAGKGESRVDWLVRVKHEGAVTVRMTAQCASTADAAEMRFPVLVHGIERMVAQSGFMPRQQQGRVALDADFPGARSPGSSEVVVALNPSLSTVMLDALPYLAGYPYGCVEQTMSRFMPSLVVAKTLNDLGYKLSDLRKRADLLKQQAAASRRTGRQNPKSSAYTYPAGAPGLAQIGAAGSDFPRANNPVFDEAKLNRMVTAGLNKLYQMQHGDGGWGWWPDDSSDAYMTAYVLYGLMTAKGAGQAVDEGRLNRGLEFLKSNFAHGEDLHLLAYEARALAMDPRYRDTVKPIATGRIYRRRERLSAYSKALLAMTLHDVGADEMAGTLIRNLETTVKLDEAGGTAHWENADRMWWCWWNDKVETNAAVLEAYLQIDPASRITAMTMKWLVNNRRGDAWASTRETALAVNALARYAVVNRELAPDYTLTVDLGGRIQRRFTVNHDNALFFDNRFVVPDGLLHTGKNPITITKNGTGTLYYSTYSRYFSLEEPIRASSNEIAVTRRYFRLIPGTAQGAPESVQMDIDRPNPFLTGRYELLSEGGEWAQSGDVSGGPQYQRTELKEGDSVTSGDQIEVDLELDARNDYTYLVFEDMKPSGCEPVELRSGGKEGLGVYSNMELRDQKVAFFLSNLPQGSRTLSYRLRTEIPGEFHVLPTNAYAMYAPEVRAISDERHLTIKDEGH